MSVIKEIRQQTSAGLMDCKKAVEASDGDLEGALKWLEAKGIAKADKKRGRVAASGLVAYVAGAKGACVVELNSESDFVAKTDGFKDLIRGMQAVISDLEQTTTSEDDFTAESLNNNAAVTAAITTAISTTGENIVLRRAQYFPTAENGVVRAYVHNKAADLPTAGVTVAVVSLKPLLPPATPEALGTAATQVAQHVVAESLSEDGGIPLREQKFMQTERTVGGYLKGKAKEAGCKKVEVL